MSDNKFMGSSRTFQEHFMNYELSKVKTWIVHELNIGHSLYDEASWT